MRTGSLIAKSICFLISGAFISCTHPGLTNRDSERGMDNTIRAAAVPSDSSEHAIQEDAINMADADTDATVKNNILLSDHSGGISILQEMNFNEDRFIIQVNGVNGDEPVVNVLTLTSPPRLVVDLLGAKTSANKELMIGEESSVSSIRLGSHSDKLRIVFDLLESHSTEGHSVDASEGEVVVSIPVSQQIQNFRLAQLSESFGGGMAQMKDGRTEGGWETQVTTRTKVPSAEVLPESNQFARSELELDSEVQELVDSNQEDISDFLVQESFHNEEVADFRSNQNSEMKSGEMKSEITAHAGSDKPVLSKVDFNKSTHSSGEVTLTLSEEIAFELNQTSQSEYVLTLPGVHASEAAKQPLVSLKGKDGIRSVRVSEREDSVEIRMFIDPGASVTAFPRGNVILVKASEPGAARHAASRAQLGDGKGSSKRGATDDVAAQANPTGVQSSDGSKSYTGRLISLDLQDTDIDNALRIIAEVSNLNIIASDDVAGKVTLRLIDVPWDQALDVILKTNGLDQVTEGNVIRIAPVDKLRREREAMRESKRAAENLEDLTVQYVRISYARAEDIRSKVEAVVSERGTVTSDERTNQLIIKDIKSGQKQAQELISKLDLRTPQVLLETQIVEGSRTILRDLGFQWNFSYIQSPQTGNATGLNFPNTVSTGGSAPSADGQWAVNFPAVISATEGSAITAILDSADGSRLLGARLSALESEGIVNVISRPQVATINNKQATIRSETTVRVRMPGMGSMVATGAGAQAGGMGGGMAFQEFNVGISLEVTPQASPDYYVLMDVNAKSSTFTGEETDNIPNTREREATSTILVKSGQTFALGGVYRIEDQDTLSGVPFFKDIPFLGFLFRRMSFDKRDEELIFFITPHIVEGSFDASTM